MSKEKNVQLGAANEHKPFDEPKIMTYNQGYELGLERITDNTRKINNDI